MNESVQQAQGYQQGQAPAPIERRGRDASYQPQYDQSYPAPPPGGETAYDNGQGAYDNTQQGYYDPSQLSDDEAQAVYQADLTDEEANEPPPPIPDYDQPVAPDPDYLWTPGYWAWGPYGYYWVPGAWVEAPYEGALWTPGYWVFWGGHYRWHHGYWARHIGFYGGIDYGYGYPGYGFYGGYWNGGHFFYNRAVMHVDPARVRFVYSRPFSAPRFAGAVSYNGGPHGVRAVPRPVEIAVMLHEQRHAPMQAQLRLRDDAERNRSQFYRYNGGRPEVRVDARPIAVDRGHAPAALPRIDVRQGRPGREPQGRGFQGGNGQWQQPGQNRQPSADEVFSQGRVRGAAPQNQPTPQNQQQYRGGQPQPGQAPVRGQEGWRPGNQQNVTPSQPAQQPQPQFRRGNGQDQPQVQPQSQPAQPPARGQEGWRPAYHPNDNGQPQYRGAPAQQGQPQPNQSQPQFRRGPINEQPNQPEQQPNQFRRGPEAQQGPRQQSAPAQPQFRRGPEQPQARPQPQPPQQPQFRAQPQGQPQQRGGPPPNQDGGHHDDHGDRRDQR